MRNLRELDALRVVPVAETAKPETEGAFGLVYQGQDLRVIASAEDGWDHVSVSLKHRTPNWFEMEFVKRRFFKDDEVAMQLHLPPSKHINTHPFVLHLWSKHGFEIPLPPSIMV